MSLKDEVEIHMNHPDGTSTSGTADRQTLSLYLRLGQDGAKMHGRRFGELYYEHRIWWSQDSKATVFALFTTELDKEANA